MSMRWRVANDYKRQDAWECYVMSHAAFIDATPVYFSNTRSSDVWQCKRCRRPLSALARSDRDGLRYYYWCRCGNFGEANADEYHKK